MSAPRTLYDKIWDDHLVDEQADGTCLLYIDRHLVHVYRLRQKIERDPSNAEILVTENGGYKIIP